MVEKGGKGRKEDVVTQEYTINLHKRLHGWYSIYLLMPYVSPFIFCLARFLDPMN
ncbi:60S ribosomal protein L31 [Platanthera guangdongensis]|uniref:60S ribosomal protein L31 n=1 Tax=Platanthera guangdongensis TaxID=2320717 RepID=A0ABR2MHM4_9ASPA